MAIDASAPLRDRIDRPLRVSLPLTKGGLEGVRAACVPATQLQQGDELIDCDSGFSDQRSQRALGDRPVIRNYEATVGRVAVPENNMAPALAIALVPELFECADYLAG